MTRQLSHRAQDRLIGLLGVTALLALVSAVASLFWLARLQGDRISDQHQSQLAACQRGNELRQNVLDQADATRALFRGILDQIERSGSPQAVAFVDSLDPLFTAYDQAVSGITLVDCQRTVGAK